MASFQKFTYYNEILTDPCGILGIGMLGLLWHICCITSALHVRFLVLFVSSDFKIKQLIKILALSKINNRFKTETTLIQYLLSFLCIFMYL